MNNTTTILFPLSRGMLNKQRGVVLIMALTILMVLTLIGVSAMKTSSLQERMSGNSRDYQIAFEAAEIALRAGEDYIKTISTTADFTSAGANGKFTARTIDATAIGAWQDETNWTSGNTTSVTVPNVSKNPEFMVEILDSTYGQVEALTPGGSTSGVIALFRVTGRGYGKNPNTKVMLQADFGKLL